MADILYMAMMLFFAVFSLVGLFISLRLPAMLRAFDAEMIKSKLSH
ncbi:hypothetical protein [Pantoea sp. ICBG 1758]|nr:hypothetical protein [Pantoea sp. ICBG 1758]